MLESKDQTSKLKLPNVTAYCTVDDETGILVDAYNTTKIGNYDCTRIFVMDKSMFSEWLKERENKGLKKIE